MSDMYIVGATTSKGRVGNNAPVRVTGTRDGAIYVCDYYAGLAKEGKIFQASHGTVTTPITFIAYDADRPDLTLDVPSGTTAEILKIQVYLEDMAGTDTEIIATTSNNVGGAGTSTALTAFSTRRNSGVTASCSAYGTHAANITLPTSTLEFWRAGFPIAQAAGIGAMFEWTHRDTGPQVLVGAAGLQIHISATTTQAAGFVKVTWAEYQSTEI